MSVKPSVVVPTHFAFLIAIAAAVLANGAHLPISTLANQLIAIGGWGLVMLVAPAPALQRSALCSVAPLVAVLGIAALACTLSMALGRLPSSPGVGVLGVLGLAIAVALYGASAGASGGSGFPRAFAIALVVSGLCGAVLAIAQVFAYDHLDNDIIAIPAGRGRAGGNIGQPNHLADTLVWGLVALVPLSRIGQGGFRGRIVLAAAGFAALLMILGVVLTGSRTGMVALVLLAAWGIADRQLARPLRVALLASPVVAVLMQWLVGVATHAAGLVVTLTERGDVGITNFRGEIWSNCLALIGEQPWLGVGWGGFNFAWTLTPLAPRHVGLLDNAHNLPLQLAVELGVPVGAAMMSLLLWAFCKAARRTWRLAGEAGVNARGALMIVMVIGLHSMLEYPLWYAYLLLPTTWAFGYALGAASRAGVPAPSAAPLRAWRVLGAMFAVVAVSAWLDYRNIVLLFEPTTASLPERIQRARLSPLFSDQADFLAVSSTPPSPTLMPAIQRSSHVLLTGRLLYAWANLLYAEGQVDKARYLAARLRELDLSGPRRWYAPCGDPAVTAKPFQCLAPDHPVSWRDFR